jgi:2-methylisocitrate lyase-like PEP mutase family enzyme
VTQVRRIVDAVAVPVIADADTGYGGLLNVVRTTSELERAGAAAIQLADQSLPKRCGHFDRKDVVPPEDMVSRVRAACEARRDPSLVIIARTDARQAESLEHAIERARAYARAGADLLFIEAPPSIDELRRIPASLPVPAVVNLVEGGRTPMVGADELQSMGYCMVIYANTLLRVAAKAAQEAISEVLGTGTSAGLEHRMLSWQERQALVRLAEYEGLENRLSPAQTSGSDRPKSLSDVDVL